MPTLAIKCINAGATFTVESEDITLGAMKALIRSEAAAKEAWKGKENGDVLAMMDALLPLMLKVAGRKDPAWKGRSVEDLEDELSIIELRDFMEAVGSVMPAAVQGEASPPLV